MMEAGGGETASAPISKLQKASPTYQYPFATSPDIIRAQQKDAYFQGVLLEHLTSIVRKIYGARFVHTYASEAHTLADLLYLGLTTFVGNRTLGEEYCDIIQVESDTYRMPALQRRAAYIAGTILVPWALNRTLPAWRNRLRGLLERLLSRRPAGKSHIGTVAKYALANLDTLTSPAPVYAVSLATFYFSGAYYHLSKRLTGLRYIFTREPPPSAQRAGYEVLGVLLVLQLGVQAYLHLHHTYGALGESMPANAASTAPPSAIVDGGVEVSLDATAYTSNNTLLFESGPAEPPRLGQDKLAHMMSTPMAAEPRVDLADKHMLGWLEGRQARKCTLCLEPMKDPSATTCGHIFCWTCICDWCREKPECPLCRQTCLVQHILPLRS